jgi:hypothetical protein
MVDLSLAIPGDALTTPGTGNGVYDATRWVVCFKYTTIDVPPGVDITFGHHPSGAPVVWLATGTVTINGRVNLDGEDGVGPNPPIIPYYTRPGPGGFEGAQADHSGGGAPSFGLGPGSSPTNHPNSVGTGASHASLPPNNCGGHATGLTYGNSGGMPLMGGSGGNEDPDHFLGAGGAGGGAILIAAPVLITLGANGSVTAQGGDFNFVGFSANTGGGSGGTIRLRAATVTLATGSQVIGRGGIGITSGCDYQGTEGGHGRVRIEASVLNNAATINGSQSFPGAPSPVFPASPPQLRVTSVCGQSASADPDWGIKTADVDINSAGSCQVQIASTGVPQFTIVTVRVIPARGNIFTVNSAPLAVDGTATANVTFPAGRSEIQLRANW